jgi:hypothetical protein
MQRERLVKTVVHTRCNIPTIALLSIVGIYAFSDEHERAAALNLEDGLRVGPHYPTGCCDRRLAA